MSKKKQKDKNASNLAASERLAIENAAQALSAFDDAEVEVVEETLELQSEGETEEIFIDLELTDEELAALEASEDSSDDEEETSPDEAVWADGNDVEELLADDSEGSEEVVAEEEVSSEVDVDGTELGDFESADIEELEFLSDEQIVSVLESMLFATDKPLSFAVLKQAFKGTKVKSKDLKRALDSLASDYADARRGFTLEEISNGYQLRTKVDNVRFLRQSVKARPFKLSGPALEVLSICAYKQPVTKAQIDEIRGVESGHLLRALMEKGIVSFGEKSELPGKPMFYETTKRFLEIFGLRNVKELPSLHEIDQLIPEGIGDEEDKETLSDLTGRLSQEAGPTYSEGEDELLKITDELSQITTSSDFFEQEKQRMREKRDQERAQDIREAMALGDQVENKDIRWLERYEESLRAKELGSSEVAFVVEGAEEVITEITEVVVEVSETIEAPTEFEAAEVAEEDPVEQKSEEVDLT